MSKEKFLNKQYSIILIIILFFGLSIVFISTYLIYYSIFPVKMYKYFPKNTEGFIEFRINMLDSLNDVLPKNLYPWFYSYKDKINDKKHGAILFYQGKKIDAILVGNKANGIKLLKSIKLPGELLNEDSNIISLSQSAIPPCIFRKNALLCSYDKGVLDNIMLDNTNIKENKNFLSIENNLYYRNDIFLFLEKKFLDKFPIIQKRFDGIGLSLKEGELNIDGLFYGIMDGQFKKERRQRRFDLENMISSSGLVLTFGGINLEKQIKDSFEFTKKENSYYALLGKGLLEGTTKNIFGGDIGFFSNILPLFSGEFLIAIKKVDDKYDFEIIAEKTKSLDVLFENFKKQSKKILPYKETFQYKELTLEQISSKYGKIKNIDQIIKGSKILGWEIEGKKWGFYFIEKNGLIRISTNIDLIANSLDSKSKKIKLHLPYTPYSFEFGVIDTNKLNDFIEFIGLDKRISDNIFLGWQTLWFDNGIQTKFRIKK